MRPRARTIRLRLTLIYGGVFLVSSTALLTVGYLLVSHNLHHHHTFRDEVNSLGPAARRSLFGNAPPPRNSHVKAALIAGYHQAIATSLHTLLLEFIGALIVMTVLSVALGWWMAGRALAPLRAITATARRVSGQNLRERIALRGPDDELKELADTFDGMLARLDAAFASQKHFVANASHELRTPLAIMKTEVEVALADPDADIAELRAMGEAVRDTIDRSEGLIAALLFLARSEGVHGREEAVDLAELAAGCVTDLHRGAEAAGISITTELEPVLAHGDPALLERMIGNLVENGIRHNQRGGELYIATRMVEGMAEIVVSNGGDLIEPEQARALTEPFRRLSRTAGGFGLGLSIVRSVAEVHSGTAVLTARPEGGLEVRVRVPADLDQSEDEAFSEVHSHTLR
jgi:signal transduction histidine kinase